MSNFFLSYSSKKAFFKRGLKTIEKFTANINIQLFFLSFNINHPTFWYSKSFQMNMLTAILITSVLLNFSWFNISKF